MPFFQNKKNVFPVSQNHSGLSRIIIHTFGKIRMSRLFGFIRRALKLLYSPLKSLISRSRLPSLRTLLLYITSAVVIIVAITIFYLNFAKKTEAAWFDDNWGYRQTVAITNSGSAQTDFQISITLDTATLITAGKMQSDCDDIRVTGTNGQVLPHWTEKLSSSACNTTTTKLWTKLPSIPTSGVNVYVYYGNPGAVSVESGKNVFIYFDDFNAGSLNAAMWTEVDTPAEIAVSSNKLVFTGGTSGDWTQSVYMTSSVPRGDTAMEYDYQWTSDNDSYDAFMHGWKDDGAGVSYANLVYGYYGESPDGVTTTSVLVYEDANDRGVITGSWVKDTNYKARVRMRNSGGAYYDQSTDGGINFTNSYTSTYSTESTLHPAWMLHSGTHNIDNFFVRKDAATVPSAGSPSGEEKSPGPVAFWRFDDGQGTTAQDSTTNNNDGTISGATWQTEDMCVSGKCLKFDGTDDYIQNTAGSGVNNTTYSFSAWIRTTSISTNQDIFGLDNHAANNGFRIYLTSTGGLGFRHGASWTSSIAANPGISANTWAHVAVVVTGSSSVKIYVNGIEKLNSSISESTQYSSSTPRITIGADYDTNIGGSFRFFFNGFIDEPKIYNYARTADQIKLDYNNSGINKGAGAKLGSDPRNAYSALSNGLVGYWKMDESSWTSDCSTGTATDSSGNGRSGKSCPNGSGPSTTTGKFGNGGNFDGTNDYVEISDFAPPTNITFSAWVHSANIVGNGDYWILDKASTEYSFWFVGIGARSSSELSCQIAGTTLQDTTYDFAAAVNGSKWYHVACTFDSVTQQMRLYRDGQLVASSANTGSIADTANALWVAKDHTYGILLSNKLDELRIYNRALSPAEVSQLYSFAPGPVGYWNFEEKSGSTAYDKSGNGLNGNYNSAAWRPGKYGSGLKTGTSSDYVTITDNAKIRTGTNSWTVEAWVDTPTTAGAADHCIVCKNQGASPYETYSLYINDGDGVSFFLVENISTSYRYANTGTWDITDGGVHHVVGVLDRTTDAARIYVDGIDRTGDQTNVGSTPNIDNAQNLIIGEGNGGGSSFTGDWIDEVRVYNYARTQKQIVQDMNAGHPAPGSPVGSAVGHWKFDQGYGTTAYDSGTGGNNGTLSGMASPATSNSGWTQNGKFGKALGFDGTNDYVDLPSSSALNFTTGNFTLSAWIQTSQTTEGHIITRGGGGTTNSVVFRLDGTGAGSEGIVNLSVSNCSNRPTTVTAVNDNKWHHVVGVADRVNNTAYIYLDGVLKSQANISACSANSITDDHWNIGHENYAGGGASYFSGLIDEVKIYNFALTADEIKLDYNRGQAVQFGVLGTSITDGKTASNSAATTYCVPGDTSSCNPPVVHYTFEEGAGSAVNDISGNNNSGTWTGSGSPHYASGKIGKAGRFDGSTDVVEKSSPNNITSNQSGTMEFWAYLRTNVPDDKAVISVQDRDTDQQNQIYISLANTTNRLDFVVFKAGVFTNYILSDTPVYALNTWNHYAFTSNGSTYKLYINGVNKNLTANTGSNDGQWFGDLTGPDSFSIGARINTLAATLPFPGSIDEVKVFDYARTPAQIAYDYNRGKPVAHWKFDECQGTTLNDSVGTASATITIGASGTQTAVGTCTGSANQAWKDGAIGKYNYSLDFDGTDDYASVGLAGHLQFPQGFSVSGWIKTTGTSGEDIITRYTNDGTGAPWYFGVNEVTTNKVSFNIDRDVSCSTAGTNGRVSNTSVNDGNWHYVAGVFDPGNRLDIYVDGRKDNNGTISGTGTIPSGMALCSAILEIGDENKTGAGVHAAFFSGQIDELKVYNYPLTDYQILIDYNQSSAIQYAPISGAP